MRDFEPIGPYKDWVAAPAPDDFRRTIKLGVPRSTFQQYVDHNLATVIAQYYGIVQTGLIFAQHAFRGLKRKLLDEEGVEAEEHFVVYSWRPLADFIWVGTPHQGMPSRVVPPPRDRVFVVLARIEPPDEDQIEGSVERWNWVREDFELPKAPVDWTVRYGEKLWSR